MNVIIDIGSIVGMVAVASAMVRLFEWLFDKLFSYYETPHSPENRGEG